MLEVTVKTLDGRNRTFCVPDDITVKDFKEKISNSVEIAADLQRLIYQGRVLQNEKKLNFYDVNGCVLHVVGRAPPSARGGSSRGTSQPHQGNMEGSFSINHDMQEAGQVQSMIEQALSAAGHNAEVSARSSADGSAVEVHINLPPMGPPPVQSGSQLRVDKARQMVKLANKTLHRLENPESSDSAGGSGRDSPMDAETTSEETPAAEGSTNAATEGADAPSGESGPSGSRDENQTASNSGESSNQNRGPRHPTADVLSDLLQQVMELNSRLEPHLERYHRITQEDSNFEGDDDAKRDAQRVQNLVSEVLHYISHIYHHISDLMIDMNVPPPRQVRAPPTSIVQQAPTGITISPRRVPNNNNATSQPQSTQGSSATQSTTTPPTTTTSTSTNSIPSGQGGPRSFGNIQIPAGIHIQAIPVPHMGNMPPPGPGGVTAHSGPFMFMEQFGPNSVTLNSVQVSATAVPDQGQTSTTSSGTNSASTTANVSHTNTGPAGGPNVRPAMGISLPPGGFAPGPIPFARGFGPRLVVRQRATNPNGSGPGGIPAAPGGFNIGGMLGALGAQGGMGGMGGLPFLQMFQGMRPPGPGTNTTTNTSTSTSSSSTATSSTSSVPTSSTATSTTSSSRPASGLNPNGPTGHPMNFTIPGPVPPGAIPGIPAGMPAGFVAIPSLPGADEFLPCQSRHLIGQRAQARATQIGIPGQANIGAIVSDIVHGLMGQQNPHLHQGQPPATDRPTSPQGSTTSQPVQPEAMAGQSRDFLMGMMRNMFSQADGSARSGENAASPTSPPRGGNDGNLSADAFRQIGARILSQALFEGGQSTDTMHDLLTGLGHSLGGEGLLASLCDCVSRRLTIPEFISVINGQSTCLAKLRGPLRELITKEVLENEPMTEENVNRAVEKIVVDVQPDIDSMFADVEIRDNIDFKATVGSFVRLNIKKLINVIMDPKGTDAEFAALFSVTCRTVVHEMAGLMRHCFRDGEEGVVRLAVRKMREMTQDVGLGTDWMARISESQARALLALVTFPSSRYDQYIVTKEMMGAEAARSKAKEVPPCNSQTEEALDVDTSQNSAQARSPAVPEVDLSPGGVGIPPEVLERLPPPPTADAADDNSLGVGSNSWHSQVPSDWIPVISRDVNRQRRQAPSQGPFSDGYLNGMSAKRRRVVATQKAEQSCAMGDLTLVVPETIKKAARAAGVEPITSHEEISRDVASNKSLSSALKEQICDSVQQRLEKDPDYVPEKYPKTEKFFNKK